MVMTPERHQGQDRFNPTSSDSFRADAERSRRFPVIDRRLPTASIGVPSISSGTFEVIVAEFTACWNRGERPHVEAFLDRVGHVHPADVVELIYHEFCLAESMGLKPDPTEFLRRFPDREASLDRLFRLHGAFSSTELRAWNEPEILPEVGDEIGPYILKRELGRGSFARVYLAEQADLDNRLVVVKISSRLTPEPRLLARARHSHIVEVLWHGSAEDGALQLICLPFLGGATLANVLTEQRRHGRRPRSGRDFLTFLDRVSAPEYPKANLARPAREIIEGLSYPAATAWVVARLAEALDHAFVRGVAHGDIKPSNILVTADGNPMLLDFNLAVGWRLPGASDLPADAGGTLAYMAPERLRAVADSQRTSTPNAADRHRADLFALGVVLLETLTCRSPDLPQAQARTRQEVAVMLTGAGANGDEALRWLARSSVPRGLRSILSRCLAPDPADRYGRASELADDLDRWRTGRPLAFAEEPPWRFRLGRWARRQRFALGAAVLAMVVCGLAMSILWSSFQSTLRKQAEEKLALVWDREESGVFRFLRFGHWTTDEKEEPAERPQHHLKRYNVLKDPNWRLRDDIRSLAEPDRSNLELWLLEQTLRYTKALSARPESTDDWNRALELLDQEIVQAPFSPLQSQRRLLQAKLNLPPSSSGTAKPYAPSQAWIEEYLLGVDVEPRRAREALAHYEAALKDQPQSFWCHYRAATVAYRLGDHQSVAAHLRACIKQRPHNVALRAQLAGCLFMLGRYDAALEECTNALEIDPDHAVSTRTRTFAHSQLGQGEQVSSGVRRLLLLTKDQSEIKNFEFRLKSLYSQGLAWPKSGRKFDEPPLVNADATNLENRVLEAVQLRKLNRIDEARQVLNHILSLEPEHLEARFIRAMLLHKHELPGADADFAYLVEHPRVEELIPQYKKDAITIYQQRTADLLRAHQPEQAIEVAQMGVIQANRHQLALGESHYALARAYAMAAKSNPTLFPYVVEELEQVATLKPELIHESFELDPYFADLRDKLRRELQKSR